jgi:hypothetical protein
MVEVPMGPRTVFSSFSPRSWGIALSTPLFSLLTIGALASGCSGGTGVIYVSTWAEDTVVEGMTTDDGWDVQFESWVTTFGAVNLSNPDDDQVLVTETGPWIADWAASSTLIPMIAIETNAGERQRFGFTIVPMDAEPTAIVPVDAEIQSAMMEAGWSHHIVGTASNGTEELSFAWGFPLSVDYSACINGEDGTDGVTVDKEGSTAAQIWLHADHLLWSRLGTEEAELAFAALAAADADVDGEITTEELAAVDVVDAGYETGGVDVTNLYDFIAFSIAQMAHLNGGGTCTARNAG